MPACSHTRTHHTHGPHTRWDPPNGSEALQTLDGLRYNSYYPQLTLEYYQRVLDRTRPWASLWIVAMPAIRQVKHCLWRRPLPGFCFSVHDSPP